MPRVTISLDEDVVARARLKAASEARSLSSFIAETGDRHVEHLAALQALDAHPVGRSHPSDPTGTPDEPHD